ncbi:Anti-sigma-K factor RskA [Rhizobium sp. NFR07]|uniref:anti-sigma factor n=1 Tax=Rhizobium sp. NFR07 TaxID=1566262 RepID=UPI0008F2261D|nr:anti-sigma factor [Rhizobium sp. NFR07]SFA97540.1 Anti-sigma-K factor RskA [Rhizobium sp. NFR07]
MSRPDQSEGDRSRDQLLAGEYVLGVLSEADRRRVEERMLRDRPFAAMVANWSDNLSGFNGDYGDEVPPPQVFGKIEVKLFPVRSFGRELSAAGAWWNSLLLWRGLTFASLAALITYVSLQSGWIGAAPPSKTLVAHMNGDGATSVGLMARYDTANGRLKVLPVAASADAARSLQLWLVPDGGQPPVSLGILPQTGEGSVDIPADLRPRLRNGVTFAVSVEPFGGSPTGQPTGPVIASGKAQDI